MPDELPRHVRLGRAFVDEDASAPASREARSLPARRRGTSRGGRPVVPTPVPGARPPRRSRRRAMRRRAARHDGGSARRCESATGLAYRRARAADRSRGAARSPWTYRLRAPGKSGDDTRDELEPGGRPACERRKARRGRRRDGVDDRGQQPEARGRAARRRTRRRSRHRVDRRLPEVEEDDRRRREAAGERDRQRVRHAARERIARRAAARTRGTATKIAATAANESWKPGSSSDVGIHAMSTSAPTARKCQRSRRTRGEPGERRESSGDGRPRDRRLPADGEHVGGDHDERRRARAAPCGSRKQPTEPIDPGGEERDVLARDGEQVIETGGAEVVLHVGRQALVLAEHDAEDDAAANAVAFHVEPHARRGREDDHRGRQSRLVARSAASSTPSSTTWMP